MVAENQILLSARDNNQKRFLDIQRVRRDAPIKSN